MISECGEKLVKRFQTMV